MTVIRDVVPVLHHLHRLTGERGLYEHARYDQPTEEHGYTTDDNSRALVVLCRFAETFEPNPSLSPYLDFVVSGVVPGGWHNRMNRAGLWVDQRGSDDAHGRAIWGLGEVVRSGRTDEIVADALRAGLVSFRSRHPRALAYAVLGAVALWDAGEPADLQQLAGDFLTEARKSLPTPREGAWRWPAARLTYANARIPEAMIETGVALGDAAFTTSGLELLGWLIDLETAERGFSFTPVAGRGPGEPQPAYDQQPVEAWAMTDACFAAHRVDGDPRWRRGVVRAARWFLGLNDAGKPLYDARTGAGHDGLGDGYVNQNRGAESTLAALGSLIRLRQLTDMASRP